MMTTTMGVTLLVELKCAARDAFRFVAAQRRRGSAASAAARRERDERATAAAERGRLWLALSRRATVAPWPQPPRDDDERDAVFCCCFCRDDRVAREVAREVRFFLFLLLFLTVYVGVIILIAA